jgi:hypothetical protein
MRIVLAMLAPVSCGSTSAVREMRLLSLGAMVAQAATAPTNCQTSRKRKNDEEDL